jgi:hypothetical protein
MLAVPSTADNSAGDLNSQNPKQSTASHNHQQHSSSNQPLPNGGKNVDSFISQAFDIFNKAGDTTKKTLPYTTTSSAAYDGGTSFSDTTAGDPSNESDKKDDDDTDDDPDAVTWKLKLSPSMMILDTNILTVSGLQKVLEQLKINVHPQSQYETIDSSKAKRSTVSPLPKRKAIMSAINSIYPPRENADPGQLAFYQKLISSKLTNDCVDEFFSCYNEPLWLLNQSSFMSTYNPSNIADWVPEQETSIDIALQAAVCSLTVGHLLLVHQKLPCNGAIGLIQSYYMRARDILEDHFDTIDLRIVTALLMLSQQSHAICGERLHSPLEQNALLTLAVKMSQELGLFQIDRRKDSLPNREQELEQGRRMAWVTLCMEFVSSHNTTLPIGHIDLRFCKVDYPKHIPIESDNTKSSVEFLAQYSKMIVLYKTGYENTLRMLDQRPLVLSNIKGMADRHRKKKNEEAVEYMELDVEQAIYGDLHQTMTSISHQRKRSVYCLKLHLTLESMALDYHISVLSVLTSNGAQANDTNVELEQNNMDDPLRNSISSTHITDASPSTAHMSPQPSGDVWTVSPELKSYVMISIARAATSIMGLLEILLVLDPTTCHHEPFHWLLFLTEACHYLHDNSTNDEILLLCNMNMNRAQNHLERTPLYHAGESAHIELMNRLRSRLNISTRASNSIPLVSEANVLRASAKDVVKSLEQWPEMIVDYQGAWSPPQPSNIPRQSTQTSDEDHQVKLEQSDEKITPHDDGYSSESSYED